MSKEMSKLCKCGHRKGMHWHRETVQECGNAGCICQKYDPKPSPETQFQSAPKYEIAGAAVAEIETPTGDQLAEGFEEWFASAEMSGWTEGEYQVAKLAWVASRKEQKAVKL